MHPEHIGERNNTIGGNKLFRKFAKKVNLMVYCNLLSKKNNILTYSIGGVWNDLTGLLEVNCKTGQYVLLEKPKDSEVYMVHIEALIRKVRPDFDKGVFKPKISYEI